MADKFGFVGLKDVCTFYTGTGFPTKYQGKERGKYPFYKVGDISKNAQAGNKYLQLCDNFVDDEDVDAIKGNVIPPNTIVFAKIGEAVKLNRRAITETYCLVDNNVMGIAPDESELSLDYFYYFMRNLKMETFAESTTVPSVRKSRLEELKIQVPTLDIQERICKKLNSTERIMVKRRQQLEELDTLIKARFVEMFGDPVENPMGWDKKQLQQVVTDDCTISYGIVQTGDEQQDGIPVFRPIDIVNRVPKLEELKRTTVEISNKYKKTLLKGRELLITVRANIADTCIVGEEFVGCNVGRGIVPLRTDESIIVLEFLKCLLDNKHLNDNIRSKAKGITLIQLNMEDLREVELIIPPVNMQNEFVDFVTQVDKLKVAVQESLNEAQTLFDSLMQEYFG